MSSLNTYLDDLLSRGRTYFRSEDALKALGQSPPTFSAAAYRLKRKHRLASPWQGFFLILGPEDRKTGAPDPDRWINQLMHFLEIDYRISLLHAAAYHGSSHLGAKVFQVIAPRQLRSFNIGCHRIQFNYQSPEAFAQINRAQWLGQIKTHTGYAKVSGIELTLLDCMRYFHEVGGISNVAQIVKDIGAKANPRILAKAAQYYENTTLRRLGYLLDHFHHIRQANALESFAHKANSIKKLDPSVITPAENFNASLEKNSKWKIDINVTFDPGF